MGLQEILMRARNDAMIDAERIVGQEIKKHGRALVEKAIQAVEPNRKGVLTTALERYVSKAA